MLVTDTAWRVIGRRIRMDRVHGVATKANDLDPISWLLRRSRESLGPLQHTPA